jgi:hypothetical protein
VRERVALRRLLGELERAELLGLGDLLNRGDHLRTDRLLGLGAVLLGAARHERRAGDLQGLVVVQRERIDAEPRPDRVGRELLAHLGEPGPALHLLQHRGAVGLVLGTGPCRGREQRGQRERERREPTGECASWSHGFLARG